MPEGRTGNRTHDNELARAEAVRQSATRARGGTQAAVKAAEITFYRAWLASARSNGLDQAAPINALWHLGVRDP